MKLILESVAVVISVSLAKLRTVVGSLPLIEPDSADLHAGLEGVTAVSPDQVINQSVRGSNLDVGRVVVKSHEIIRAYREGKRARLRIVKGRAIDIELRFVEEIRREGVLERQQVVRWMVDGLKFVPGQAAAVGRIDQADVTLGAAVKKSLLVDFVVNSY